MQTMKQLSLGLAVIGAIAGTAPSALAVTAATTGSAYIVTPLVVQIWHPLNFSDISKGTVDSQVTIDPNNVRSVITGDAVLLPAINAAVPTACRVAIAGDDDYQFELQLPENFSLDAGNKLRVHSFTTNLPGGFGTPNNVPASLTAWSIGATLDIPTDAPLGLQSASFNVIANYI